MNRRERLAVYLVGQYVVLATLTVLVGRMLGRLPSGAGLSYPVPTTLPTRVAMRTLDAAGPALLLGYLVAVVAVVVAGRSRVDGSRYWTAVGVTALSLPGLVGVVVVGFVLGSAVGPLVFALALVAGGPGLAIGVAGWLGAFDDGDEDATSESRSRIVPGLGGRATLAVVALLCLGVLVGVAGVGGGAEALVEERGGFGTPQVAFATSYEAVDETHGVLTVRHDGGDAVPRTELYVRGAGITAVDGVDQTEAGEWAGDALWTDGAARVEPGNETTVGVRADCEVDVVYQRGGDYPAATTLDAYECPEHGD
jgi:hypothetical protein